MIELQFQYRALFNVKLENNYFEDNNLRNFKIEPLKDTLMLIDHLGYIFRVTETGFLVLADNQQSERLVMQLESLKGKGVKLGFLLYITDPIFRNYTNVPFDTSKKIFHFSNVDLQSIEEGKLHKEDFVSGKDLRTTENIMNKPGTQDRAALPSNIKGTPFGLIELVLNDSLIEKMLDALIDNEIPEFKYKIAFDSRSVVWKYVIIPSYVRKLKDLRIAIQEGEKVNFSSPESVFIKEKEALVIQSEDPIKFKEFYDFSFQLKRGDNGNGGKTVIKKMQYAHLEQVKPLNRENENDCYSEIYVYI
jgi:hypothetical protein